MEVGGVEQKGAMAGQEFRVEDSGSGAKQSVPTGLPFAKCFWALTKGTPYVALIYPAQPKGPYIGTLSGSKRGY